MSDFREWDQDIDAAYANGITRRIAVNRNASEGETIARNSVSALTRQFNVLIHQFELGETIDARQLESLGVQIAAAVGVVHEMRHQNLFRIAS